jgi:N-acetylglucosamine-6-phosphate deacetylase
MVEGRIPDMIAARHFETGEWIGIEVDGGMIRAVRSIAPLSTPDAPELWVAPAFYDIQTNGRWGHSYASPELTIDQVEEIVLAQRPLGTARLCPTFITAPEEHFLHGLRTIAAACERSPEVSRMIAGIHLEGPFLSERDGYRGAHPVEAIRDPDWDLFERFQEASGNRVILMTLAPERPGAIEFIRKATSAGVRIALGHTAADGSTIRAAVDAGATLSTHLGNGIVAELPRHPNPIWYQAAEDRLSASFIADGHHVDLETLRVLIRAKGIDRTILVSDASPLAGLPPGTYGRWAVDPSGKIVVAGTPYLAGSNQALQTGLRNLLDCDDYSTVDAIQTVTRNPARLLGLPEPRIARGEPANLVLFTVEDQFTIQQTCIDGTRMTAIGD